MNHGLHFISGLPRSGSTLLSALLRQNPRVHAAMTSPVGSRLLLVRFETLTVDPARAMAAIYDFIGEPQFTHRFDDIQPDYDAMMFDARIGSPGLHAVGGKVSLSKRDTILPPDLFAKYTGDAFWDAPEGLPENVRLV